MENQEKGQTQFSGVLTIILFVGGVLIGGVLIFLMKGSPLKTVSSNNVVVEALQSSSSVQPVVASEAENTEMTKEQKLAVKIPTETVDLSKTYMATLKSNVGDVVIKLDVKNTPLTANNFIYLSRLGFYDNVIFHRVIAGFMVQGGDPLGTGTGGPAYKFKDEITSVNSNAKGTIAMANSGPNTNGSQFFINLVDNNFLDTKHTVFGKVVSGMDVVEKIGKMPVDQNNKPLNPVIINSVEITEN